MKLTNQHLCPICGKGKGGNSHKDCSKQLQAQHLNDKRPRKVKALNDSHAQFLSQFTETK